MKGIKDNEVKRSDSYIRGTFLHENTCRHVKAEYDRRACGEVDEKTWARGEPSDPNSRFAL